MQEEKNVGMTKNPLAVVYRHIGEEITVILKTGERYTGLLSKVDNYMNLLIENAVEEMGNRSTRYGTVLIRGNNILLIKLNNL